MRSPAQRAAARRRELREVDPNDAGIKPVAAKRLGPEIERREQAAPADAAPPLPVIPPIPNDEQYAAAKAWLVAHVAGWTTAQWWSLSELLAARAAREKSEAGR